MNVRDDSRYRSGITGGEMSYTAQQGTGRSRSYVDSTARIDRTPGTILVTGRRKDFVDALEPGDVLLFQGADFLAGLAQLTERRTAYHSAIYLGHRVLAHNVSLLWWWDAARRAPYGYTLQEAKQADGKTAVDRDQHHKDLWVNLAANQLVDLDAHTHLEPLSGLHGTTGRPDHALTLMSGGGVGAITLDSYLDRHDPEWLYGDDERITHHRPVHHVRSVVALRHHRVDLERPETAKEVSDALLAAVVPTALAAVVPTAKKTQVAQKTQGAQKVQGGFDAAELVSFIPDIADRPGYREWGAIRKAAVKRPTQLAWLLGIRPWSNGLRKSAEDIVRERLRTISMYPPNPNGMGWICASFVDQVYKEAGLDLRLATVDNVALGPVDAKVPLSTPRDLYDSDQLTPVALLARGPERWRP